MHEKIKAYKIRELPDIMWYWSYWTLKSFVLNTLRTGDADLRF